PLERLKDCADLRDTAIQSADPFPVGSLLLTRPGRQAVLQLLPLHVVGPVYQESEGRLKRVTHDGSVQAYFRCESSRVEYTVLHLNTGWGVATADIQAEFERLFPSRRWREERERSRLRAEKQEREDEEIQRAVKQYKFRDIVTELDTQSVDRGGEVEL